MSDVPAARRCAAVSRRQVVRVTLAGTLGLAMTADVLASLRLRPRVPPLLLPPVEAPAASCSGTRQPVVRAVLTGVSDYSRVNAPALLGPGNDVRLFATALRNAGVAAVQTLSGAVTQPQFVAEIQRAASASECGDTLLLLYSGYADAVADGMLRLLFSDVQAKDVEAEQAATPEVLFKSDADLPFDARTLLPGTVDGRELLVLAHWLRERGVNVALVVDTNHAPSLGGHADASVRSSEQWLWRPWSEKPASGRRADGERGAFFAILAPTESLETQLPPGASTRSDFGVWSYAVANALLSEGPAAPFRQLAQTAMSLFEANAGKNLAHLKRLPSGPVFEATHPERALLATGLPGRAGPETALRGREDRRIELSNPPLQRGASVASTSALTIEGRIVAKDLPRTITANQTPGRINRDGSFSVSLPLVAGENRVALVAWWSDVDFLPKAFTVVVNPNGQLQTGGRRFALIIANQRYRDPGFETLATPHADADALAELLRRRYGFVTDLPVANGTQSLVLKDASREAMTRALSSMRRVLQPDDALLVFFAGHGLYEKATGQAYWLPVDAERDEPPTWLSAYDVQTAINRLNARHVLVVADSCFSGAFAQRGTAAEEPPSKDRLQFLGQSMLRPSRRYISSGANEPVADGGGGGHSLFARALLDALRSEDKPFTSGELFTRHLVTRVGGQASQVPQFFPMKEGHEGGDLVFAPLAGTKAP